jgi:BMFP domain-containing protein YqiC
VLVLKQSLENERKELNDCRAEITSLKMHIEGSLSRNNLVVREVDNVQSQSLEKYEEEIKKLHVEIESLKVKNVRAPEPGNYVGSETENLQTDDKVIEIHEDRGTISNPVDATVGAVPNEDAQLSAVQPLNENANNHEDTLPKLFDPANTKSDFENIKYDSEQNVGQQEEGTGLLEKEDSVSEDLIYEKTEFIVLL